MGIAVAAVVVQAVVKPVDQTVMVAAAAADPFAVDSKDIGAAQNWVRLATHTEWLDSGGTAAAAAADIADCFEVVVVVVVLGQLPENIRIPGFVRENLCFAGAQSSRKLDFEWYLEVDFAVAKTGN
mgnify:CR=1 FL=1